MTPSGDIRTAEERFGHRLRALREERSWSQERVAQQMTALGHNWRQTTVFKTENAARPIRLNDVAGLAQVFGVPIAALLDPGATPDSASRQLAIARATAELEEVRHRLTTQIDGQLRRLHFEDIDLDVEQAQRRWRDQQPDREG
jgi:transcriptional regulator with XRE-family HTH domain